MSPSFSVSNIVSLLRNLDKLRNNRENRMGHFDGRLKQALTDAVAKAKDKAFYDCLKSHGFYDVADQDNGLKDWERASVPEYNQHRMTALAESVADMCMDLLGNDEYGVLTVALEEIINKIDLRCSMTASEMDVVGGALGGLTSGVSESARQAISSAVAAAMAGNKFDPDVIPPISLGLSGLPFSISNCYKPGMLAPNYEFLYEWEANKQHGFYAVGNDLYLGPGIPMNIGGAVKILVLRTIFGVPNVDKNAQPEGDLEGGLTLEEFQTIQKVMDMGAAEALALDETKNFVLNDKQMRASFFRYIHFILWNPISVPNNWGFLHWGVLANNACPEPIRTAVCSYLRTEGLAIDPAVNPEAFAICHCLNAGMAYYVGRDTPVTLVGLDGQNVTAYDKQNKVSINCVQHTAAQYPGVKKDQRLANLHFTLIADILAHLTKGSSENDTWLRQRRVAEANLIYNMVGMPTITYGAPTGKYSQEHTGKAAARRGLVSLMTSTLYAFKNETSNLVAGDDVKIIFQNNKIDPDGTILQERSKEALRYAGAVAGVKVMPIASLYRPPERQGATMAENWHRGDRIKYGPVGRQVNDIYVSDAAKHPGSKPAYVDDGYFRSTTKPNMVKKCIELCESGQVISRHCWDYRKIQAIDISAKQLAREFKYSDDAIVRLGQTFFQMKKDGILRSYIAPDGLGSPGAKTGEPAFHIEVYITGPGSEISLPLAKADPTAMSPKDSDQVAIMSNPNFISVPALDAVFVKDNVDKEKGG